MRVLGSIFNNSTSAIRKSSVDPDSPNPDPAFQMNPLRFRVQGFDDQKWEKIYFLIKNFSLLIL
jgi:hypothetical protein